MGSNLFDVLNKVNTEHVGKLHAYFSNNVENVNAGHQGWGNIKIAITTDDAHKIMSGIARGEGTPHIMLFVVDRETMDAVQREMDEARAALKESHD